MPAYLNVRGKDAAAASSGGDPVSDLPLPAAFRSQLSPL